MPLLEIIACSPEDCRLAQAGGADRIELCAAIEMGGLTPSAGLAEQALSRTTLPIMAMVRPRSGGFNYTKDEFDAMLSDVRYFKRIGIQGIVFGILTENRTLDTARMKAVVEAAETMETVSHRAFDVTPDPIAALESIIDLKITRVLTSGQRPTAIEGKHLIKTLVERAMNRIQILPGAGLKLSNVVQFAKETGVNQVHLTAFHEAQDRSMDRVDLTFNGREVSENAYRAVSPELVKEISEALANPPIE